MDIKYKEIPKSNGTYRVVAVPGPALKRKLQELVPHVTALAMMADKRNVMHGFVPGRSPLTNARQHVGMQYTLSMDLQDFFYNCGVKLSYGRVSRMIPPECLITHKDKRFIVQHHPCVQGLPTSPAVANALFSVIDTKIRERISPSCVYTRYADDMTFSTDDLSILKDTRNIVNETCYQNDMPVAHKKTRFQSAAYGHRIITGCAVTDTDVRPTRKTKRKLRAALHQGNGSHAAGLEEWCRMKDPDIKKYVRSKLEMVRRRFGTMTDVDISRLQASLAVIEIR